MANFLVICSLVLVAHVALVGVSADNSPARVAKEIDKLQPESESDKKIYVMNIPRAPKGFISTTLSPSDSMIPQVSISAPGKNKSTAIPQGMTNTLKNPAIRRRRPANAIHETTICGRVPVFEERYAQSINEAFNTSTGDSDDTEGDFRILHGVDAEPGEWPWIVKIDICADELNGGICAACTGSLINSRWVLTAAHCGPYPLEVYRGRLGLYDLIIREKTVVEVTFDKKIVHPKFNENLDNDILLLRLSEPIEFNQYIQPICIFNSPNRNPVEFTKNRKCYNIGYGLTLDMTAALKLQKLEIEAKNPEECNESDEFALRLRDNDVCIGPRADLIGSACKGDSGGPNACYDPHTNQWYLFSTVSYGPSECDREEGDKWLTVSVETARYIDWLDDTIKQNS